MRTAIFYVCIGLNDSVDVKILMTQSQCIPTGNSQAVDAMPLINSQIMPYTLSNSQVVSRQTHAQMHGQTLDSQQSLPVPSAVPSIVTKSVGYNDHATLPPAPVSNSIPALPITITKPKIALMKATDESSVLITALKEKENADHRSSPISGMNESLPSASSSSARVLNKEVSEIPVCSSRKRALDDSPNPPVASILPVKKSEEMIVSVVGSARDHHRGGDWIERKDGAAIEKDRETEIVVAVYCSSESRRDIKNIGDRSSDVEVSSPEPAMPCKSPSPGSSPSPVTVVPLIKDEFGWLVLDRGSSQGVGLYKHRMVNDDDSDDQSPAATIEKPIIVLTNDAVDSTSQGPDKDKWDMHDYSASCCFSGYSNVHNFLRPITSDEMNDRAVTTPATSSNVSSSVGSADAAREHQEPPTGNRNRDMKKFRKNYIRISTSDAAGNAVTNPASISDAASMPSRDASAVRRVVLYSMKTMDKVYPKETEVELQLRLDETGDNGSNVLWGDVDPAAQLKKKHPVQNEMMFADRYATV